jgi:hypothetical protein
MSPLVMTVAAELRADLADYHALREYDFARYARYGDMARARRGREINRLGDALLRAGVPIDREGNLPASTPDELAAAFERVLRPRYRRWAASVQPITLADGTVCRRWTKYARGTFEAWQATARTLGVTL